MKNLDISEIITSLSLAIIIHHQHHDDIGQVRALLVSRTYATREDLSRAIAQDKQHQVSAGFLQSSLPSHCYHVTMISLFPSTIIPVQETRWH